MLAPPDSAMTALNGTQTVFPFNAHVAPVRRVERHVHFTPTEPEVQEEKRHGYQQAARAVSQAPPSRPRAPFSPCFLWQKAGLELPEEGEKEHRVSAWMYHENAEMTVPGLFRGG